MNQQEVPRKTEPGGTVWHFLKELNPSLLYNHQSLLGISPVELKTSQESLHTDSYCSDVENCQKSEAIKISDSEYINELVHSDRGISLKAKRKELSIHKNSWKKF